MSQNRRKERLTPIIQDPKNHTRQEIDDRSSQRKGIVEKMQATVDEGWKPNLSIEFPAFEVGIHQGSTKDQLFCHRPDDDHCDH